MSGVTYICIDEDCAITFTIHNEEISSGGLCCPLCEGPVSESA